MTPSLPSGGVCGGSRGFSLLSLMLVAAIIALLSSVATPLLVDALRRQRLNNMVIEFAGWLEAIAVRAEHSEAPCRITIPAGDTKVPGAVLAQVTPPSCSSEPTFRIPTFLQGSSTPVHLRVIAGGRNQREWLFASRGSIHDPLDPRNREDMEVRLNLENQRPVRCVVLTGVTGLLRLGSNNETTRVSDPCTRFNRI